MSSPGLGGRVVRGLRDNLVAIVLLVLVAVALRVFVPAFFTTENMKGLGLAVSMVGMVACTMLFCLASGDFDLSVEAIVAACGVLTAVVAREMHSGPLAIACGVLGGGLAGLLNGVLIAKLRVNALIATLGTMLVVRGVGYILCGGKATAVADPAVVALGAGMTPVWITAGCFVVFGLLLTKTVFGANTLAIGGNREAARLAGIPVDRVKIAIFTLQGVVAGSAGVILSARMGIGDPKTSQGFSLAVISACVLGGVSLSGGVGTIWGVLIGVLVMGTVNNTMNLMNVDTFYQYVAMGVVLLAAVLFDQFGRRRAV